jgi:hypothetical protein
MPVFNQKYKKAGGLAKNMRKADAEGKERGRSWGLLWTI